MWRTCRRILNTGTRYAMSIISNRTRSANVPRRRHRRYHHSVQVRDLAVHREADRTGAELCQSGRHRQRECAAADELRQSLEQQTATAEVLGVISSSKFELQPILQTVVDTAARLCRAEWAVIFRLDNGVYHFAVGYSLNPTYLEIERLNRDFTRSWNIGRAGCAHQAGGPDR